MAEQFIQLPANSTGTKMRTFEQTVGANVVDHQAVVLCDSSGNIIGSLASAPTGTEQGLVVRNIPSGTQPVSLATNTPDVTDRAARLLGAVSISDVVAGPTAITTQNLNPNSGAATANSTVSVTGLDGVASIGIQITGTYTGALTVQGTVDGTNWVTLPANLLSTPFGLYVSPVIPSATQGYLTGSISGVTAVRVSANAAVTGTATVTIRASSAQGEIQGVQGLVTPGQTATGNAVRIGGSDGGSVLRDFSITAKGTQGAFGLATQDLKDAGRAPVTYYTLIPVLSTSTDTLQSLTGTKGGATVTATTTPAVVTTGKTFRIELFSATYIATATSGYAMVRLRYNTGGVVAITSPILESHAVGAGTPATANSTGSEAKSFADGLEVPAGTGIGISVQGFTGVTATAVGYVRCSISGYEY